MHRTTTTPNAGCGVEGYEMLKELRGVMTHEHSEWIPILENSQDMEELSGRIDTMLDERPAVTGHPTIHSFDEIRTDPFEEERGSTLPGSIRDDGRFMAEDHPLIHHVNCGVQCASDD